MEFAIVLGVILGVAVGVVMGAIGVQLKTNNARSRLESEAALVRQRLEIAERDNEGLRARSRGCRRRLPLEALKQVPSEPSSKPPTNVSKSR